MRLCVFQGTFNPIHNAHLRIIDYVSKNYEFDKILVIPAFIPPHKNCDADLSEHRLIMVKLAFQNNNYVEVSDIEYKRGGKSYTYITICELYKKYKIEGKINFVIGTDAFDKIESWYEVEKLKDIVRFIVFIRENEFEPSRYKYLKDKGYDFVIEKLSFEDVSSSDIRKNLKKNELPKIVKEYIEQNGLYKN